MGAEASKPAQRATASAWSSLRRAGDCMNTLGYPAAHEKTFAAGARAPHRVVICRCWKSLRFPACDNSHFQLQKEGVAVGPVMLEIKASSTPVGDPIAAVDPVAVAAAEEAEKQQPQLKYLGTPVAAFGGAFCALTTFAMATQWPATGLS
mmetsp:Transcript_16331/g.38320  ORF Transcript_16331/g.38320 Transcript_16331/m.38320 type:complete len:150 (+) Transcript_16331:196-645(+)